MVGLKDAVLLLPKELAPIALTLAGHRHITQAIYCRVVIILIRNQHYKIYAEQSTYVLTPIIYRRYRRSASVSPWQHGRSHCFLLRDRVHQYLFVALRVCHNIRGTDRAKSGTAYTRVLR